MSENRAITVRAPAAGIALIASLEDAAKMAKFVAESGLFTCKNAAEAMVKICAGLEMGFPAIAAMTDIHIISGKPSVGAHLMAAAIRRSGKYDYEIREHTDDICSIAFFQLKNGAMKEVGVVTTTLQEAKDKGWTLIPGKKDEKAIWIQKPKNMLFARTISDGYKFYTPDITGGMLVYDRDELESEPLPASQVRLIQPTASNSRPAPVQIEHGTTSTGFDLPSDPERKTKLTVNDDGSLRSELDDIQEARQRIEHLVRDLGITKEQMRKKLDREFGGVESIHQIAELDAIRKLEEQLIAARNKRIGTTSATTK